MRTKAKGQTAQMDNPELLALALALGGLAERLNAPVSKTGSRARNTTRGFESYTRRQINTPTAASTAIRAKLTSAEAERTLDTFIIGLLAVELNRRFHSDLPQLPDGMPEIR